MKEADRIAEEIAFAEKDKAILTERREQLIAQIQQMQAQLQQVAVALIAKQGALEVLRKLNITE